MDRKVRNNRHQNIIGILILALGIFIAFAVFYHSNVGRITAQNRNYIEDTATNRAASLGIFFEENLHHINTASIALEAEFLSRGFDASALNVESAENIPETASTQIYDILSLYQERFGFDYLRYVDRHGRYYSTRGIGVQADVSQREYYQRGIEGHSGVTYILTPVVATERQFGFYAPVYASGWEEGEIIGVVVGFFGEDRIRNLISVSIFDYPCEAVLCDRDGTVIQNTAGNERFDNFLTAVRDGIMDMEMPDFSEGNSFPFTFRDAGRDSVGYAAYIGSSSDYYIVVYFPPEVYQAMITNANRNGVTLLVILVSLFLCVGACFIIRYIRQRRRIIAEADITIAAANDTIAESGKMITALASDYWGVYYLELDKNEGICYQAHTALQEGLKVGEHFPYLNTLSEFVRHTNYGECDQFLHQDHHEALVTREQFQIVQDMIAQHRMDRGIDPEKHNYKKRYPFSGKLVCGECGSKLKRVILKDRVSGNYIAWVCSAHVLDVESCSMKNVPEESIKAAFTTVTNKLIFSRRELLEPFVKAVQNSCGGDVARQIDEINQKLDALAEKSRTLNALAADNLLEPAALKKALADLADSRAELNSRKDAWRCRNRVEKKGAPCFAPTVHEDELQDAVVRAIRQAYGTTKPIVDELQQNTLDVLTDEAKSEVERLDEQLQRLQEDLVKRVNAGEDYDDLSGEIRELKQQKDEALGRQASQEDQMKHIQEMEEFLSQHDEGDLVFKDSLVRKLIYKVEVFREKLIITFKTGREIEIEY